MRTHYNAMQIHATDEAYAGSDDSRARFRAAAFVSVMFVAALVFVHFVSWALGLDLQRFGIHPRDVASLGGVVMAPLLHGDVLHLASNALPLLIGGTALLYLYPDSSRFVLPAVYVVPGILVWLFARDSIHIGASGLVYGIVAYVFIGGILRRDRRAWAASILVAFLYGAMVWGVLPIKHGVSWETHLAAAVVGVVLGVALRGRDVPPRKVYSWEIENAMENAENATENAIDSAYQTQIGPLDVERPEPLTSAADSPRAAG